MMNETMGNGMMDFGFFWMVMLGLLIILAVFALAKYLMK
jgi:hypothetical protein